MIFSEAKAALDLLKEAAKLLHEEKDPKPELVAVFEALRKKLFALYESEIELRLQVKEWQDKLAVRDSVFFDEKAGVYFKGTPEAPGGDPFCAKCYHSRRELVPMQVTHYTLNSAPMTEWKCVVCALSVWPKREEP